MRKVRGQLVKTNILLWDAEKTKLNYCFFYQRW